MKSYASVDRIEGKYLVCEVELISVEDRNREEYIPYDTTSMDIPLQEIPTSMGNVRDGDILIIEHDGENMISICCKDENEKARRLELLRESLMDW